MYDKILNTMKAFTALILLICLPLANLVYAWDYHTDIRSEELTGDDTKEIIIESKGSGGTGSYYEEMRIYQDNFEEMKLIFKVRTLWKIQNKEIVSTVEFMPPGEDFSRDIKVTTDGVIKIYKWEGISYEHRI